MHGLIMIEVIIFIFVCIGFFASGVLLSYFVRKTKKAIPDTKNKESMKKYIEENIQKNVKVIAFSIGEIIVKSYTLFLTGFRLGLVMEVILIFWLMSMTPYLNYVVDAIFKGEAKDFETKTKIQESQLQQKDELYRTRIDQHIKNSKLMTEIMRSFTEMSCQLAARDNEVPEAIKGNAIWEQFNRLALEQSEGKITSKKEEEEDISLKDVCTIISGLQQEITSLKDINNERYMANLHTLAQINKEEEKEKEL